MYEIYLIQYQHEQVVIYLASFGPHLGANRVAYALLENTPATFLHVKALRYAVRDDANNLECG